MKSLPSRRLGVVWALALAVTAFAGCSDDGQEPKEDFLDPSDPDSPTQTRVTDRGLIPPEWDYGDWWRYANSFGDAVTHVVTEDTPTTWTMDVDTEDTAFYDARFDISFIGTIRKPDLAGRQGDTWVEFIKWPLKDGLEWDTTWDGEARHVKARDIGENVFRMQAFEGDTLAVEYTYDHDIRWFTGFRFFDEGRESYNMTLEGAGKSFSGELYRYTVATAWDVQGPDPTTGVGAERDPFTVNATHTDVWASVTLDCVTGTFLFQFSQDQDPSVGAKNNVTCPYSGTFRLVSDAVPGNWNAGIIAGHPADTAQYSALILLRTLTKVTARSS